MNITPHITAQINLGALISNYRIAKTLAAGRRVIAVVKADAYGHGAVGCVRALSEAGADFFAVSNTAEAAEIRPAVPKADIIILGWTDPADAAALVAGDIIQTAADAEHLRLLEYAVAAAKARGALPDSARLRVHIKIDTGMNRIGIAPEAAADVIKYKNSPHISVTGAFTHMPCADMPPLYHMKKADGSAAEDAVEAEPYVTDEYDDARTRAAAYRFMRAAEQMEITPLCRHFANSASILRADTLFGARDDMPDTYKMSDAVRAGIILYGLAPSPETDALTRSLGFTPVMTLRSTVSHIHTVKTGDAVSYGGTWAAPRDSVIATVPAGYADGIPRSLSNRGGVFIGGQRFPIRGRVCMDQLMVDVTDAKAPVKTGDTVEFFGRQAPVADMAADAGTISYEIISCVSKRVKRETTGII